VRRPYQAPRVSLRGRPARPENTNSLPGRADRVQVSSGDTEVIAGCPAGPPGRPQDASGGPETTTARPGVLIARAGPVRVLEGPLSQLRSSLAVGPSRRPRTLALALAPGHLIRRWAARSDSPTPGRTVSPSPLGQSRLAPRSAPDSPGRR